VVPEGAAFAEGRFGVVVAAAGEGRRIGAIDKVFVPLLGEPLICHTVRPFEEHPAVGQIVLVVAETRLSDVRSLVRERRWRKVTSVCAGGRRRQDSVRMGLAKLTDCDWVMAHDGARPCVDRAIIDRGVEAVYRTGAAVAAVPVKDTVKVVTPDMTVDSTLRRDSLWAVQTPQVFQRQLLVEAHRRCKEEVTDDAAMVERMGHKVGVFMGSYENLKVTTPEDLVFAEAILRSRAEAAG
jgi:2-C-methyl-D-erythritol 4-phosphate cytidylyltransferase